MPRSRSVLRFISCITLVSFLWAFPTFDSSSEANPGVIVAGAVALGALLVAGGTVSYHAPANLPTGLDSHYLTKTGAVLRMATAAYGDYQNTQTATLKSKLVTAKVFYSDLVQKVWDSQTTYPHLFAALEKSVEQYQVKATSSLGETASLPSNYSINYFQVVARTPYSTAGCYTQLSFPKYESAANGTYWSVYFKTGSRNGCTGENQASDMMRIDMSGPVPPPPPQPKDMYAATTDGVLAPPVTTVPAPIFDMTRSEIDYLLKANPNVVHFLDTADPLTDDDEQALPYAPPTTAFNPDVATPEQQLALTAGNALAQAAASAAAAAEAAKAAADAHPDDPALAVTAARAKAEADRLAAEQAAAASKQAAADKADKSAAASLDIPEAKVIDWAPFLQLNGALASKFPFTMFTQVGNVLSSFASDPVPPVINIPMPLGLTMVIDLAPFDPLATLCRYLVATLVLVGVVYYVVRRYTD